MRGNPNQTFEDHKPQTWVKAGEAVVFYIPTDDAEAIQNIVLVVDDILKVEDKTSHDPVSQDGGTIYSAISGYTTYAARVNVALANVAEHYGLEVVVWFSGTPHAAKPEPQGSLR